MPRILLTVTIISIIFFLDGLVLALFTEFTGVYIIFLISAPRLWYSLEPPQWVKFSADVISVYSYFSMNNRYWHFMQIVTNWDNLHENMKSCFLAKIRKKIHKFVAC